jgi:hypothetical protein
MPGIHVLPKQGDFARPGIDHAARFRDHRGSRPARLRAARVGHHAKAAKLVAAFLDGEESREPAGGLGGGRIGQKIEF